MLYSNALKKQRIGLIRKSFLNCGTLTTDYLNTNQSFSANPYISAGFARNHLIYGRNKYYLSNT
jgi:hypothetical protein